jgi:hypothetical protein
VFAVCLFCLGLWVLVVFVLLSVGLIVGVGCVCCVLWFCCFGVCVFLFWSVFWSGVCVWVVVIGCVCVCCGVCGCWLCLCCVFGLCVGVGCVCFVIWCCCVGVLVGWFCCFFVLWFIVCVCCCVCCAGVCCGWVDVCVVVFDVFVPAAAPLLGLLHLAKRLELPDGCLPFIAEAYEELLRAKVLAPYDRHCPRHPPPAIMFCVVCVLCVCVCVLCVSCSGVLPLEPRANLSRHVAVCYPLSLVST